MGLVDKMVTYIDWTTLVRGTCSGCTLSGHRTLRMDNIGTAWWRHREVSVAHASGTPFLAQVPGRRALIRVSPL